MTEDEEESKWLPDRSKFKDTMGRYLTQSLFLEIGYDQATAVYTLKDEDYLYKGVLYPSLRRLYMEECDPTEYHFAAKYLWGWDHWQKLVNNQDLYTKYFEGWREELEVKLRSQGVRSVILQSFGNFNAAKWVADGHWQVKRGRPSKEEQQREKKIRERAAAEAADDSSRIVSIVRPKTNG